MGPPAKRFFGLYRNAGSNPVPPAQPRKRLKIQFKCFFSCLGATPKSKGISFRDRLRVVDVEDIFDDNENGEEGEISAHN